MRILALAILTIATVLAAPSARAQRYDPAYPVCLHVYQPWGGSYYECSYTSLAQCNATASGRSATCDFNPYYAPYDMRNPVRAKSGPTGNGKLHA